MISRQDNRPAQYRVQQRRFQETEKRLIKNRETIREEARKKKEAEEAERKAKEERIRKEREEAENARKKKAEEEAKKKADEKRKAEEAERKRAEEEKRKKDEASRKAKLDADRKAKEEAERKAKEEAARKAKEDSIRKADEQRRIKARQDSLRQQQKKDSLAAITPEQQEEIPAITPEQEKPTRIFNRNSQKQDRAVREQIDENVNWFNSTLSTLKDKLKKLKQDVQNGNISFTSPSALTPVTIKGADEKIATEISKTERDIDMIERDKSEYVNNMNQFTRKNQIKGFLSNVMTNSDEFRKANVDLQDAKTKSNNFWKDYKLLEINQKGLYSTDQFIIPKLWKIGDLNKVVNKRKYQQQKVDEMQNKYSAIQRYMIESIFSGKGIPSKIEDFPEHLRDKAKSAFTVNGKFVLEDEDFRTSLLNDTSLDKKQIKTISDYIKNAGHKQGLQNEDDIQDKLEWVRMQKHLTPNESMEQAAYGLIGDQIKPGRFSELSAQEELLQRALHYKNAHELLVKQTDRKLGEVTKPERRLNPVATHFAAYLEFFTDKNTYLFDLPNIATESRVLNAYKKLNSGEQLTKGDKEVLEAKVLEDQFNSEYGDYQNFESYKWGKIGAESLKFMAEFIATNGAANTLQEGARAATRAGYKALRKVAMDNVSKYGKKAVAFMMHAPLRVGVDAAYAGALTNTLGLPKTILDATKEAQGGHVKYHVNDFGQIEYDYIADNDGNKIAELPSFTEALWNSEKRNFIENYSEMMGEWGMHKVITAPVGKLFGSEWFRASRAGKVLSQIEDGLTRGDKLEAYRNARRIASDFEKNKTLFNLNGEFFRHVPSIRQLYNSDLMKAAQFHGFFGEVAEEYYGLAMQHLPFMDVADNKDLSLLEDMKEQTLDIWGGIGCSMGVLGGFGVGHYMYQRRQFNNSIENLDNVFGADASYRIQRQIAFADPYKAINVVSRILSGLDPKNNKEDQKKYEALLNYQSAMLKYRGAVYGAKLFNDVSDNLYKREERKARELGYSTGSYLNTQQYSDVASVLAPEVIQAAEGMTSSDDRRVVNIALNTDNLESLPEEMLDFDNIQFDSEEDKKNYITKALALQNALAMKQESNRSVEDGINDNENNIRKHYAKLVNVDAQNKGEGRIFVIGKKKRDNEGKATGEFEGHYAIVRGTDKVNNHYGNRSQIDKLSENEKDDEILVANLSTGEYELKKISELEGYSYVNPTGYLYQEEVQRHIDKARDAEAAKKKEILSSLMFDENMPTEGKHVILPSGQKLTILSVQYDQNTMQYGIDYAISDQDGNNETFHHANSYDELKDIVKDEKDRAIDNIKVSLEANAQAIQNKKQQQDDIINAILKKKYYDEYDSNYNEEYEDNSEENVSNFRKRRYYDKYDSRYDDEYDEDDEESRKEAVESFRSRMASEPVEEEESPVVESEPAEESTEQDDQDEESEIVESSTFRDFLEMVISKLKNIFKRKNKKLIQLLPEESREDIAEEETDSEEQESPIVIGGGPIITGGGPIIGGNGEQHDGPIVIGGSEESAEETEVPVIETEPAPSEESSEEPTDEPAPSEEPTDAPKVEPTINPYADLTGGSTEGEDNNKPKDPGAPGSPNTPPQNEAIDHIVDIIEKRNAQRVGLNAYHYIINDENGKPRLYRRAHSAMDSLYPDDKEDIENLKRIKDQLIGASSENYRRFADTLNEIINEVYNTVLTEQAKSIRENTEDKDLANRKVLEYAKALKNSIRFKLNGYNEDLVDNIQDDIEATLYLDYLKDNFNKENCEDISQAVAEILKEVLHESEYKVRGLDNPSVITGSIYDEICRTFLDYRNKGIPVPLSEMHVYVYGKKYSLDQEVEFIQSDGTVKKQRLIDDEAYKAIIEKLQIIKQYYIDNGYDLVTDEYTTIGCVYVNGKKTYLAGTTDCIAVKNGKYELIDFKTYSHQRGPKGRKWYDIIDSFGAMPRTIVSTFFQKERKTNRSYGEQYTEQGFIYTMLAQVTDGISFDSRSVLLLGVNKTVQGGLRIPTLSRENFKDEEGNDNGNSKLTIIIKENDKDKEGKEVPNIVRIDESCSNPIIQDLLNKLSNAKYKINQHSNGSYDTMTRYDQALTHQNVQKGAEELKSSDELSLAEAMLIIQDQLEEFQVDNSTVDEDLNVVLDPNNVSEDQQKKIAKAFMEALILIATDKVEYDAELIEQIFQFLKDCGKLGYALEGLDSIIDEEYAPIEDARGFFTITAFTNAMGLHNVSTAKGPNGELLKDVTGNPDFVNNAEFKLQFKEGTKNSKTPTIQVVITYNGVTYSPVEINFARKHDDKHSKLADGSKDLYNTIIEHLKNEEEVYITPSAISRTNGLFDNSEEPHKIDTNELVGKSIYEIEYSSNSTDFGITKSVTSNGCKVVVKTPHSDSSNRTGRIIYVYKSKDEESNDRNKDDDTSHGQAKGVVVAMVAPKHDEVDPEDVQKVPVNIFTQTVSPNQAEFITQLLLGDFSNTEDKDDIRNILNSKFTTKIGGKMVETPFTNIQILNMFISYGAHNYNGKQHVRLQVEGTEVSIIGNIQGVTEKIRKFDLSDQSGREDFAKALQGIRLQITEKVLMNRFDNEGFKNIFDVDRRLLFDWFNANGVDSIEFGNSGINITKDDVSDTTRNTTGEKHLPISGLGWYIRNGHLVTQFNGFKEPLFSIDEAAAKKAIDNSEATKPAAPKKEAHAAPAAPVVNGPTEGDFGEDEGEGEEYEDGMTITSKRRKKRSSVLGKYSYSVEGEQSDNTINEKEAKQHIADIIGDFPVSFYDKLYELGSTIEVGGIAHKYMIKLSRRATNGVEYHEAFHILINLLMDEKDVEKAFAKYRKKFGKDLTREQLEERAADEFWYFMQNRKQVDWHSGFKNIIKEIGAWWKFYRSIGSFTLYRMYNSAAKGKYKHVKPALDRIEKFGLPKYSHEVTGMKGLDHIVSSRQYDAVLNTIRTILLDEETYSEDDYKLDPTGRQISHIKMDLGHVVNSPMFDEIMHGNPRITEDAKTRILEVLGLERNGVDEDGNDIYKIVHYGNAKIVIDQVAAGLKKFGAAATTLNERQVREKYKKEINRQREIEDSDDEDGDNLILGEKGVFDLTSAEMSSIDRTSASVKFFFSRVTRTEAYRFIDMEGNVQVKTRMKLNEAGLPEFISQHEIWNIVLNQLHDVSTIYNLYNELKALALVDPDYIAVYDTFVSLLDKAFQKVDGKYFNADGVHNAVLDHTAYGQCIEIVSYLHQAKTIPTVVNALQEILNENIKGSTQVIDANNESVAKQIRGNWGKMLASGDNAVTHFEGSNIFPGNKKSVSDPFKRILFIDSLLQLEHGDKIHGSDFRIRFEVDTEVLDPLTGEVKVVNKPYGKSLDDLDLHDNEDGTESADLSMLKMEFIRLLNQFCITVTIDDLNFMLDSEYGDHKFKQFKQYITDNSKHMEVFYKSIRGMFTEIKEGVRQPLSTKALSTFYSTNYYVGLLASGVYGRLESKKEMQFLTINGKRIYAMSEHNHITDELDKLKNNTDGRLDKLLMDPYYAEYVENMGYSGSEVLRAIDDDRNERSTKPHQFEFQSVYGMKTDAPGNEGIEYLDLSTQEDVILKYGILAQNGILFPTMSDKTTYGSVFDKSGQFKLLGIDFVSSANLEYFSQSKNASYLRPDYITTYGNGRLLINFDDNILKYFEQIYRCEYESAMLELERLEQNKIAKEMMAESFHNGRTVKIKNPITGEEESHTIHQGARLSTFTGIFDEDGNFISLNRIKNDDGTYMDERENLKRAHELFFGNHVSQEERFEVIKRILSNQVEKELTFLAKYDMIYQAEDGYWRNGLVQGLDAPKLKRVQALLTGIKKDGQLAVLEEQSEKKEDNDEEVKKEDENQTLYDYQAELEGEKMHNAIIAYVGDMVVKQQQSMQESFRMYAGNFASFKWKYDEDGAEGALMDTTTDFFKRTGGFVSTGQYNVPDLADVDPIVHCAEIKDERAVGELHNVFMQNAPVQAVINQYMEILRSNYYVKKKGKLTKVSINIDDLTNDEYKAQLNETRARLEEIGAQIIEKLKEIDFSSIKKADEQLGHIQNALKPLHDEFINLYKDIAKNEILAGGTQLDDSEITRITNDYVKQAEAIYGALVKDSFGRGKGLQNIDVNDGATFITDEFAERLLKSIGKWNNDVKAAFEILRSAGKKEGKYSNTDIMQISHAYNLVQCIFIGTQKYTGYGRHFSEEIEVEHENIDGSTEKRKFIRSTTYYDKTAYFPIFSCMATGHLKAVLEKMHDPANPVDVLKLSSAIKEGGKGAVDLNEDVFQSWDSDPSKFTSFKFNTYTQSIRDIRKQFNTDPKEGKELMNLGTQYVKVVLSLLKADQIYDVNGVEMDALQMRTYIMDAFKDMFRIQQDRFEKKYFNADNSLNVTEFMKLLQTQIDDKEPTDQLRNALSVIEQTEEDGEGNEKTVKKLKLPISCLASTVWIESIVTSAINKELININTPGQAFYQRPDWAIEGKMPMNYVNQDNFDYTINHGAKLKQVNENGSIDCVVSIDFFDFLFEKHKGLKRQSFMEKKVWLIKHGIISGFDQSVEHVTEKGNTRIVLKNNMTTFTTKVGDVYLDENGDQIEVISKSEFEAKEDKTGYQVEGEEVTGCIWKNAKPQIVGYRIPTQAVSSIQAMRCVDVIPVVHHTVILPKEITAVTGSDFDIDKFFMSTFYYDSYVDENIFDYDTEGDESTRFNVRQRLDELEEQMRPYKEKIREIKRTIKNKDKKQEALDKVHDELDPIEHRYNKLWSKHYKERTDVYDKETTTEYHANKLLEAQIALLCTKDRNLTQTQGSIDSDTKPLEDIAKKILNKTKKKPLEPGDALSMRANVEAKISFAIGKSGIGPYALNNNNHVLTMLYGVKFVHNEHSILNKLGLEDLSRSVDNHGHSILSWISGLINAHVDVAKDPFIRSLGVNKYTYNLVSLLIRTGYGAETFWFTTQPVMNELYDVYDRASGIYGQPAGTTASTRTKQEVDKFFIDKVNQLADIKNPVRGLSKINDTLDGYFKKKYDLNTFDLIYKLMKTESGVKVMETLSTTDVSEIEDSYEVDGLKITYNDIQLITLAANRELQEHAKDLSTLVQHTKIDTKKQGKTVLEQAAYESAYDKLLDEKKSPFEYDSICNMLKDTFIDCKTRGAIGSMRRLLEGQLLQATPQYQNLLKKISIELNQDRSDVNFVTVVDQMIQAKIRADYLFMGSKSYCKLRDIHPTELMYTKYDNSIYNQLKRIQCKFADTEFHGFDHMKNENGECTNYLIRNLICGDVFHYADITEDGKSFGNQKDPYLSGGRGAMAFILRLNDVVERVNEKDMKDAWRELLNDSDHQELQRFAEQLIVFAFITSANVSSGHNLFRYVPEDWMCGETDVTRITGFEQKGGRTFGQYMEEVLERFNDDTSNEFNDYSEEELTDLILNFSYNSNLIPLLDEYRYENSAKFMISSQNQKVPMYIAPVRGYSSNEPSSYYNDGKFPGFIKVRLNDDIKTGPLKYGVYKAIKIGQMKDESGKIITFPIYALMNHRGGLYGSNKIYDISLVDRLLNQEYNAFTANDFYSDMDSIRFASPGDNMSISDLLSMYANTPTSVFMELLHLMTTDVDHRQQVTALLDSLEEIDVSENIVYGFETLKQMLENTIEFENTRARNKNIDGEGESQRYQEVSAKDAYDAYVQNLSRRDDYIDPETGVRIKHASSELHVEELDSRYSPIKSNEDVDNFFKETGIDKDSFLKAALNSSNKVNPNIHIELYKKQTTIDGKGAHNYVFTISKTNNKHKGWFEVVCDVKQNEDGHFEPSGEYSVHFKTFKASNPDARYAQVELSQNEKNFLFQTMLAFIPEGGLISTRGQLTEGGLNAIYKLDQRVRSDMTLVKDGEREAEMKDGSKVMIPIWKKTGGVVNSFDLANNQDMNKTDLPIEDQIYNALEAQAEEAAKNCNI